MLSVEVIIDMRYLVSLRENFLFGPSLKLHFFLDPETKFLTHLASLEVSFSNLTLPSSPASNTVKWHMK